MLKIVCHGDSLTEGKDVEPAYRWPALLKIGFFLCLFWVFVIGGML